MPEGDTVWYAARRLGDALTGRQLTRTDFRVPRYATTDLTGRQVTGSVSRGKHLLTRVEGGVTVHTHLKMDGAWRVRPAGERAAGERPADGRPTGGRAAGGHRIRLVLGNDTWQAIGYQLGIVEVLRTAREDEVVGHLGPDLLGQDWDPAEAVRRLRADPDRQIGDALLDQRNLAGIGNVYKSEVLFLRGIQPGRPAGAVPDLDALVSLAHRLLDANKNRIGHITTGHPQRGAEHWVYGRGGRPCRRCGTIIKRADQGPDAEERVTFWCPSCQP